jgi:Ras-related protein Rab-4B
LLVYDVTSRESYNSLPSWLNGARAYASPDIQVVLVGNKTDLAANREVTLLEASRFAQENGLLFLETSAVTGECVDEVFVKLAAGVLEKADGADKDAEPASVLDQVNQADAASGCRC